MRIYQENAPKQGTEGAQQAQGNSFGNSFGNPFAQMGGNNPFKDATFTQAEEVK